MSANKPQNKTATFKTKSPLFEYCVPVWKHRRFMNPQLSWVIPWQNVLFEICPKYDASLA